MAYKVVAPYVTLKVRDRDGAWVVVGFYAGATVPDEVDEVSLNHHVDSGLIVEDDAELAVFAVPSGNPLPEGGPYPPLVELQEKAASKPRRPSQADPKAAWVDYAVDQGADRETAESSTKQELISQYGS